jgi:hypothetical protein
MLKFGERVYIKVIIYEAVSRDLFAATRAHQLFLMFSSSSSSREEIKRTSGRSFLSLLSSGGAETRLSLGISPITRKMTSHSKRSPSARLNQFAADAIFRVVFLAKLIVACGAQSIESISHSHIPK